MKVTTETSREAVIGNINTYAIMIQTERMSVIYTLKSILPIYL